MERKIKITLLDQNNSSHNDNLKQEEDTDVQKGSGDSKEKEILENDIKSLEQLEDLEEFDFDKLDKEDFLDEDKNNNYDTDFEPNTENNKINITLVGGDEKI